MAKGEIIDLRPNLVSFGRRKPWRTRRGRGREEEEKRRGRGDKKGMDSMSFGMDLWISFMELYGILRFCMVNSLSPNLEFC